MARRILMTGEKARYVETRPASATADEREIVMSGESATYEEMVGAVEIVQRETDMEFMSELSPLESPEALRLWEIAEDRGWVDANRKPRLSENKAAVLADVMADCLNLSPRWKPFEDLWEIEDLCNKRSKALNQKYFADLQREFKDALK